jgi:hypothetical protein
MLFNVNPILKSLLLLSTVLLSACSVGNAVRMDQVVLTSSELQQSGQAGETTTIPFTLDSQRIVMEISLEKPNGGRRTALAWFNMGMAQPVLSKALYQELQIGSGQPLRMQIGDRVLQVAPHAVVNGDGGMGVPEFSHLFAPLPVETMLPASVLQEFVVTLDYGRRVVTLTKPSVRRIEGVAIPARVNPRTGIVSIEISIAGNTYPIVIDAGSGYSWIRGDTARGWLSRHPEWQRSNGAIGQANANMVDFDFEKKGTLLRIPQMRLDDVRLQNVGVLGTGPVLGSFLDGIVGDIFWDNWQKGASTPVIGWIGGNILKHFSVTIDYPNRVTYWQQQSPLDSHDLDQVGVNLIRKGDRYFIGGLVRRTEPQSSGPPAADIQPNDELIAVDHIPVRGISKDAVLAALHGVPGDRRVLVIEHRGVRREIETTVIAFD